MYRLILSFGSNTGNRESNLSIALKYLHHTDPSFKILKQSAWIETLPFQGESCEQPNYLNFVCECTTTVYPINFYQEIIVPIEDNLGHSRDQQWASRALDIDILLCAVSDGEHFSECSPIVLDTATFALPHKRLLDSERKILQDLLKETFYLTDEHIQCHFIQNLFEKN